MLICKFRFCNGLVSYLGLGKYVCHKCGRPQ